jgi:hypothetical protein
MSQYILGIDSLAVSSQAALNNAISKNYLGQAPAFWGRYFYAPGQINSSGHKDSHYSAAENGFLRSNGIRLLPLARQTGRVGTDSATGSADARLNVNAIFEAIPAAYLAGSDPNPLVFLDVVLRTRLMPTIMRDGLRRSLPTPARFRTEPSDSSPRSMLTSMTIPPGARWRVLSPVARCASAYTLLAINIPTTRPPIMDGGRIL